MDCLARGGGNISQRDYLLRGGTQTLGGSVKVESVTALRSAPQWLTATTSSLALTPCVGITLSFPIISLTHTYVLRNVEKSFIFYLCKTLKLYSSHVHSELDLYIIMLLMATFLMVLGLK